LCVSLYRGQRQRKDRNRPEYQTAIPNAHCSNPF
jgi:hypothetical protein